VKTLVAIAPHYITQSRRLVLGSLDTKAIDSISKDTGISVRELEKFAKTGDLDYQKIVTIWSTAFGGDMTPLQVHALLNANDYPDLPKPTKPSKCPACNGDKVIMQATGNSKHPLKAVKCPHCKNDRKK
jgi:hypothetical protein